MRFATIESAQKNDKKVIDFGGQPGGFGKEVRMQKNCWSVLLRALLVAMVAGFVAPRAAHAQAGADARIERLEAAMKAMHAELAQLKAERARDAARPAPAVNQKQIDQMVTKAIDQRAPQASGAPSWLKTFTPFGDFRLRHEYMDDEKDDTDARNRNRIRVRVGVKAKFNDEWDATFRIATGNSNSPTSTNQTLGESSSSSGSANSSSFGKKNIWLDLAYADWHPKAISGLNVYGGKMKNPFYRVGGNQVIWDSDVNPEGGAIGYEHGLGNATTAYLKGGGFWIREHSGEDDVSLMGLQSYLKHKFDDGTHVLGGFSYYDYGNLENTDSSSLVTSLKGNTPTTPGGTVYNYDYDIAEGFVEYGFSCNEMPVTLFGNYVENTAAPQNNNAYALGFVLNKAKKPKSWQFGYYYRDVELDAVVGGLNDSDFIDGGTDGRGHVFGYKYQWTKNIQTALTYFDNDKGTRRDDFKRLQLDLIFKF